MCKSGFLKITITLAALGLAAPYPRAEASSFYYELQAGVSQFRGASPFYGEPASPSSYGPGFNLALAYSFSGGDIPAELQLGLNTRLSMGPADDKSIYYGFFAPYPMIRLQLSRLFFTVGVSPYLWRRLGGMPGADSFQPVRGSLSFLGEGGFLWPVTPTFSLGTALAGQYIRTDDTWSPSPILEATVVMRFYFGFSKPGSGSSSNEFKGWRYPFGNEIRN